MRRLAQLALAATSFAALFGCSQPRYSTSTDLGTVVLDFEDGPHRIDVVVELSVDDPDTMSCKELTPTLRLDWVGDDGDVALNIITVDENWEEDAYAEDGQSLTSISGTFRRCALAATIVVDAAPDMVGAINASVSAGRLDGNTRGHLTGEMSAEVVD